MVARLLARNHYQHVQYLELMADRRIVGINTVAREDLPTSRQLAPD
jgi:hypothetical protein